MARQNGFETLQQIKDVPQYRQLPIIILATSSAESDRSRSYMLGAGGLLTKPLSNEDTEKMLKILASEWL